MSAAPPTTTFTSRGRLSGVVRQRPLGDARGGTDDLDTQAYEAIYYRARLILGETLPRPDRLRAKGPLGD